MPFTTFPIPSVELQSIAGDARSAINALENSNAAVNTAIALDTSATTTAIGASAGGSGAGDANKIAKFQADGGLAVGQSINLATENATVVDNDFIGVSAVSTPNATRKSKLSTVWDYIKSKIESAASFSLTGQWAFSSSTAGNTVTITQTGTGNALEVIGNATDDARPEIKISGSGGFIDIHNELSIGSWNPLAQSGDKGIIFSDGGAGTGDLLIAPWSISPKGLKIAASGGIGIGANPNAGRLLDVRGAATGATDSTHIFSGGAIASDVTAEFKSFASLPSTAASEFTLGTLDHYRAGQGTFGAGSSVTNQTGFKVGNTLVGASNNYGFFSDINSTSATVSNVALTSNVATITTSANHGFLANQRIYVLSSVSAVNGTYTITSVPSLTTLTYSKTNADIPSGAATGSISSQGRWNVYSNGTAPNFFKDDVRIGSVTGLGGALQVVDSSTSDLVRISQSGTGNAFVVEDDVSTDSTPFTINNNGLVFVGSRTSLPSGQAYQLQVQGSTSSSGVVASRFSNDADGPIVSCLKSRNATIGSYGGVVASGDGLGKILFAGDDGVTSIQGARIEAFVDGTPGVNDMPGRLTFSTTANDAATPTERMRITQAGNVGIGTTSPAGRLSVDTGSGNTIDAVRITNLGTGNSLLVQDSTSPDATPFVIDTNGSVGVGSTTVNASCLLEMTSTTKGFKPPSLTTTERNAIATPLAGVMIYNSTTNKLNFYNGTGWEQVTSA